ncbi:TPA: universal stress protein [Staphylococcus aureus]|nr:universal stress protein [Staphylococcus aureus]HAR4219284.1 universal stress protein [Staphylococcus aureus]
MSTRGLNIWQEMEIGNVNHKVAKRAQIPLIIFK